MPPFSCRRIMQGFAIIELKEKSVAWREEDGNRSPWHLSHLWRWWTSLRPSSSIPFDVRQKWGWLWIQEGRCQGHSAQVRVSAWPCVWLSHFARFRGLVGYCDWADGLVLVLVWWVGGGLGAGWQSGDKTLSKSVMNRWLHLYCLRRLCHHSTLANPPSTETIT